MKSIITISREFGAGGAEIGQAVAERLGYYYCDKDMIIRAAREETSFTAEELSRYDEKAPLRLGPAIFDFYDRPLNDRMFEAQRKAIIKVASKGKCVILGRNANSILQQYERSLHVFISATLYFKLQRLRLRMPTVSDDEILDQMKKIDKARSRYCSYYTNTEFGNADYYDLMMKSSTLGIDTCVDLICQLASKEE